MCRTPDPVGSGASAEEKAAPADGPEPAAARFPRQRVAVVWKGVRTVLCVLDVVAAWRHAEAVTMVVRALVVVGDMIVGADRPGRS